MCAVYHYTDKLGAKFLGLVPYLIPAAWFMMSYPSFIITDRLIPANWKRWQRILAVAAVGGLVMTAWDVIMDPIMVAGGHWVWDVVTTHKSDLDSLLTLRFSTLSLKNRNL